MPLHLFLLKYMKINGDMIIGLKKKVIWREIWRDFVRLEATFNEP